MSLLSFMKNKSIFCIVFDQIEVFVVPTKKKKSISTRRKLSFESMRINGNGLCSSVFPGDQLVDQISSSSSERERGQDPAELWGRDLQNIRRSTAEILQRGR